VKGIQKDSRLLGVASNEVFAMITAPGWNWLDATMAAWTSKDDRPQHQARPEN
jgi:hypothetical protein